MKRISQAMGAALLLAAVFTCPFPELATAEDGDPGAFRIGVALSLSGEFWEHGRIELAGAVIRAEELNAQGGVDGRRVELVVMDTASDPGRAARAVEALATQGVSVIIGPAISGLVPAVREAAARHDVIAISPSATLPGLGKRGDRVFSIMFGDDLQGTALAAFMLQRLSYRRAAILLNADSGYSRSIADAFSRAFVAGGGEIVAEKTYTTAASDPYDLDFAPLLIRLEDSQPDFVLLPNYHDEVAAILSQATRMGMRTVFCGGDAWDTTIVPMASGKSIDGAYFVSVSDPDAGTANMENFLRLLNESNEIEAMPSSATGYDAVSLAVEAARGGGTGEAMIERLYALRDYPLATGDITIDPRFGTLKTVYISRIADTGDNVFAGTVIARVVLEPDDNAPGAFAVKVE